LGSYDSKFIREHGEVSSNLFDDEKGKKWHSCHSQEILVSEKI
jgi:hypothetical protein